MSFFEEFINISLKFDYWKLPKVNVKEDDIVFFPSKTPHSTQPANNNEERISISADIVCIAKNSETLEHLTPPYDNWKKI